ncbi:hypothetical protein M426DRAFT_12448 [Hypoxylon sp. CI-4A]|nr:hypothetical protein M426DRAFT_12448 [Hypoxylon sp. CI-4A]
MSHPQQPMPQRQFSPQQSPNQTYQLPPPTKRTKLSPGASSNPGSPYPNYAASPRATTPAATPTAVPSPAPQTHANSQAPSAAYTTPYQQTNGRPTSMSLTMPTAPLPTSSTPIPSPQLPTPMTSHAPYSTAKLAPVPQMPASSMQTIPPPPITNMGPPALNTSGSFSNNDATRQSYKPASNKEESYEVNDMLMGTGIDLEAEQEFVNNLDSVDTRGFPNYPPGGRDSFYGAGPANQPAGHTDARTQEELVIETADRTWNDAAARLARSRAHEIANHLLEPGAVHKRLHETAQKFGLGLNLEMKHDGRSYMGRMQNPNDFPKPELKVVVQAAPDDTYVRTLGSFIPPDAFLVDQIALLSISTKQRLRELIGDANRVATTRQTSAHGVIPQDWLDAATIPTASVNGTQGESQRTGEESAVSPRTNPLKRPSDELNNGLPTPVSEASPVNYMVEAMTNVGKEARNAEEGRLKKRQKRLEKPAEAGKEGTDGGSRAGSVAPGTPGSIAPDPGEVKPPTKKESKKAAKMAEASSATVNQTLGLFAGSKKKKYSWLTSSGPGSGASTPRLQATGTAAGTQASGAAGGAKAAKGPLTQPGVTQLGQFREDSDKGKNIQLRDWLVVLEERGFDQKSIQQVCDILDQKAKARVENTMTDI